MPIGIDQCFVCPSIRDAPNPMPALVFLHGRGQRGNDLSLVTQHGPPYYAASGGLPSPELMRVIAPQCPLNQTWSTPATARDVAGFLATLRQAAYVDSTRIYLTGWSMGGYGVCSVLVSLGNDFPVAAAAVVSGGCREAQESQISRRLAQIPFFVAYGENDASVLPAESLALLDALREYSSAPEVQVYSDPNGGQPSAHVLACRHAFSQPHLYKWLLQHRRAAS
jgi:predicted peptidase